MFRSVKRGAHVGISTAELFKYKGNDEINDFSCPRRVADFHRAKDVRDGRVKVVNLLTEDSGYVPFAYVEYAD